MKILDYRDDYYSFTGKLSDNTRQLAFAGIALIWIFRKFENDNYSLDHNLYLPSILIVLALGFDLLQYIYQSLVWASYYSYYYHLKNKKLQDEVKSSWMWNIPTWILYIFKVLFVVIAYYKILIFLMKKLII